MCRGCGALVFAGKSACFACGMNRGGSRGSGDSCSGGGKARGALFTELKNGCRRIEETERCLSQMDPPPQNAKEFSLAMNAFGRVRAWQRVLDLLDEMEARGIRPDTVIYNNAITACGRAGEWKSALRLLDEMADKGLTPSIITFSAAISACDLGVQPDHALQLLAEMRRAGFFPDVIVFTAVISACSTAGRAEDALRVLHQMEEARVSPNAITINATISACGAGGEWREALKQLRNMRRRGLKPNVVSFSAAVTACERAGQPDEALSLLDEMRADGVEPGTITCNAALAACGRVRGTDTPREAGGCSGGGATAAHLERGLWLLAQMKARPPRHIAALDAGTPFSTSPRRPRHATRSSAGAGSGPRRAHIYGSDHHVRPAR